MDKYKKLSGWPLVLARRSGSAWVVFGCCAFLLAACSRQQSEPGPPVEVCQQVTSSLLQYALPEKIAVTEQEIHGERIVVHLTFKRPEDQAEVKSVCVYGFDRYNEEGQQQLYRKVPTRMAIDGKQITEEALLLAITASGFKL